MMNVTCYTYEQAGKLWNLSEKSIQRLVKQGLLKSTKFNGAVRISHIEMEKYIKEQTYDNQPTIKHTTTHLLNNNPIPNKSTNNQVSRELEILLATKSSKKK